MNIYRFEYMLDLVSKLQSNCGFIDNKVDLHTKDDS